MSVTASIGISTFSSGTISKVSYSKKVETKIIKDYSGAFSTGATFNPEGEFSVEGEGSYPSITLGIASQNIPDTISGGVIIIDSFSKTEASSEFPKWSYKGKHYPSAS